MRVFSIKRLIDHTALAPLKVVAVPLAVSNQSFLVAEYQVDRVSIVCPLAAYTVTLVPVIIGTYCVFRFIHRNRITPFNSSSYSFAGVSYPTQGDNGKNITTSFCRQTFSCKRASAPERTPYRISGISFRSSRKHHLRPSRSSSASALTVSPSISSMNFCGNPPFLKISSIRLSRY